MSEFSLSEINDRIAKESTFIDPLRSSIGEVIVGQDELINKILIKLFFFWMVDNHYVGLE